MDMAHTLHKYCFRVLGDTLVGHGAVSHKARIGLHWE